MDPGVLKEDLIPVEGEAFPDRRPHRSAAFQDGRFVEGEDDQNEDWKIQEGEEQNRIGGQQAASPGFHPVRSGTEASTAGTQPIDRRFGHKVCPPFRM